jgi:hypothetical protein
MSKANNQSSKNDSSPSSSRSVNDLRTKYYFVNYINLLSSDLCSTYKTDDKDKEKTDGKDLEENSYECQFTFLSNKLNSLLVSSLLGSEAAPAEIPLKAPEESELYFMCREPHLFIILGIFKTQKIKEPIKRFVGFYQETDLDYKDLTRWSPQQKFTRQLRSLAGVMRKIDIFLDYRKFKEKGRVLSREDFVLKSSFEGLERLEEVNHNTRKTRQRPIRNKIDSLILSALTGEKFAPSTLTGDQILILKTLLEKEEDEN